MQFENEEQKKTSIVSALKQGKDDIFWKVIVKALEENIKQAEARLHGEIKLDGNETIEFWQKIRNDRIEMISLPDTLIKDSEGQDKFDPKLDPYD